MSFITKRKKRAKIRWAKSWPGMPKPPKKRKKRKKLQSNRLKITWRPRYNGPLMVLRDFQRVGVDFLAKHNHCVLLADAPGCGKTPQVLVAIKENKQKLCPTLIVVPASVVENWRIEAERWIPGVRVILANKIRTPLRRQAHITVTTWAMLATREAEFASFGFRYLVCDEAHYAKNPEAQRTQAVVSVSQQIPHITLLTGTPLVNDADELSVLKGLISQEKEPPMIRRLLEDVAPDIPRKRRVFLQAAIPDEIRHEYDEVVQVYSQWLTEYLPNVMDNPLAIEVAAERALSAESLSKLSYLRRILGRGKVPAAAAWILNMVKKRKEKVVVFGQFIDVLDLLGQAMSKLGVTYVRLDGATSHEQRQAAIEAFQNGEIDVFVGSQAAHEGITLHRAANLLFLERGWTPAGEEQAEDRIRRIGQKRTTTIWYLHAENTLDDRITEIVEHKRRLVSQHIGTADIQTSTVPGVFDVWQRIKTLSGGVPLVSQNPRAALDLPPLPKKEHVFSVIFDAKQWPLDALQRHLRRHGYRTKEIKREGLMIQIRCKAVSAFRSGSVRRLRLARGIWLMMGRPETRNSSRMRIMRDEKRRASRTTAGQRIKTRKRSKSRVLRFGS